ncbi:MAG: hypothetical protein NTX22_03050 [Ignavibacteriales bacterium]|nr:hypothetical protein [Ignavibacteriales bacterium]
MIFFCLGGQFSYAQIRSDSLIFASTNRPANIFSTRFDKQLSTYNLRNSLYLNENFGNYFVGLYEDYFSTLIKLNPKSIKDEQYFSFITEYSLHNNFQTGIFLNNNILSDDRKLGLNEASIFSASFFTRWRPYDSVTIAPHFGYSINRQIGENDAGYLYGAEALVKSLTISDFEIHSTFKFLNDDISPRKNTLRYFNLNLSNSFDESFRNILSSSFQQSRKDFYFKADSAISNDFNITNNIQSRTESNYFLQDKIAFYNSTNPFSFDLIGRVVWRDIDRDTRYRSVANISSSIFDVKVNEFRLEFESTGNIKSTDFDGNIRLMYSERDERHLTKNFGESNVFLFDERQKAFEERSSTESEKNNRADRISISLSGRYRISTVDTLSFSLLHNKLQYDTPSKNNFDDRDELLSIVRLYYIRKLNPFFDVFINLEGSLNHIVYIYSERSSNNNYQRVIRLGSGGNYNGKNISSRNLFEVSSNYTVYDFEDLNPNYRSFSFRQLSYQDSSSIRLTNRLFFNFYGYIKLSEQGDFKWTNFSGRPIRDLEEIYIEPKLNVKILGLFYGIGIRYLTLKTYMYKSNLRSKESDYRSVGPLAEISIILKKLNIRLYGWYEFIKTDNKRRELANLNVQMFWNL